MLEIKRTTKFKKDIKKFQNDKNKMAELKWVINELANQRILPDKYRVHLLIGNYIGHYECHIKPDWLLIYKVNENILTLTLTRIGSHADLLE